MRNFTAVFLISLAGTLLCPGELFAKTTSTLSYRTKTVWSSAVRHLRIARKYTITEKDFETGYVLFSYKDGKRERSGSLELSAVKDRDGRPSTLLIIELPQEPSYRERILIEEIQKKIRTEHGDPEPPPEKKPPKTPPETEKKPDEAKE